MNPLGKKADRCRQVLSAQQITMEGPGTILRDVETILEFIGPGGLKTKSQQGNLPAAVLPELNARLAQPIESNLQRPLLRDYPNIAGYMCCCGPWIWRGRLDHGRGTAHALGRSRRLGAHGGFQCGREAGP
ncbi:MAG: hypothetical protein KJ072_00310 [Verrucomicrobia bacterium]|nr:hypothetical protein [Verrucomicrobiota bacterium]